VIKKQKAKEMFLKIHFYKYNYSFLAEKSKSFSNIILQFTYKEFDDFIKNIDFNLHEICIVSASLDLWMSNIAKNLNMKLICTQSQVHNNSFIGINSNCYGIEKVNRIVKVYNLDNYDEIHVFGDSNGDSEMLKLGHRHYKFFN
jgi:HAD superfamily phosphoserine phosphatase-like hydrolase